MACTCRCRRLRHFSRHTLQWRGSVFPHSFAIALPCALITAAVRIAIDRGVIEDLQVLQNSAIWNGFTILMGFLIFFRTSAAYQRFWDGCTATHNMRLEWFEACSCLMSYTRHATADDERVDAFQHLVVRLFSVLHAAALAEVEDSSTEMEHCQAFKYSLLDIRAIDRDSLQALMDSDDKVALILQWIQNLVVDHMKCGVICVPPPLLTQSFQQLFNGVVAFHSAIKIASIPFPYRQMCDILLMMHWLGTPIVTTQWVDSPLWGAVFSFVLTFIYWCLNMIASDIENPFGHDSNDIDGESMQTEMNRSLQLLLEPESKRTPNLRVGGVRHPCRDDSLMDAWAMEMQARDLLDGFADGGGAMLAKRSTNMRTREVVFREPNNPKSRARKKKHRETMRRYQIAHHDSASNSDLINSSALDSDTPWTPEKTSKLPSIQSELSQTDLSRLLVPPITEGVEDEFPEDEFGVPQLPDAEDPALWEQPTPGGCYAAEQPPPSSQTGAFPELCREQELCKEPPDRGVDGGFWPFS